MTLNLKRKAAIEDLFDRYYQRGDVDTITVSTIPITSTGIQLLISCPSMHGLQRSHEALNNSITQGLSPTNRNKNNKSGGANNNNNVSDQNGGGADQQQNNNNGDQSAGVDNNNNLLEQKDSGNKNGDDVDVGGINNNNSVEGNGNDEGNNNNNNGDEDENNNSGSVVKRQPMLRHNQGDGGDNANTILHSGSSAYNLASDPNAETEEERREKHTVRCGVETILQLAKFKQASVDSGSSSGSSVMIHSQYSNFLLTQFVAGPLLITLSARRSEGRSLGLLVALANEIKAEPVFKQFIEAAIETRLNG